ncbi:hypothetical protein [Nitrosomonas sp. Nm166]|uniref:hypothetical protein n=1 Tax=Nitrosomonas sp. Nm166 TaxID=1881054 RepID=UPI0008F31DB3|nr:hypothetical protein [Nitrosomonas sp. Nm166]SFD98569.1 hypothetical protein SAMN05428977_100458 [Nitrosomonas sp. Nm166]
MFTKNAQLGEVIILVTADNTEIPIRNARVTLTLQSKERGGQARQKSRMEENVGEYSDDSSCEEKTFYRKETNEDARAIFEVPCGYYEICCEAFGVCSKPEFITVIPKSCITRTIPVPLEFNIEWGALPEGCQGSEFNACAQADEGTTWIFRASAAVQPENRKFRWTTTGGSFYESDTTRDIVHLNTHGHVGETKVSVTMSEIGSASTTLTTTVFSKRPPTTNVDGKLNVSLTRTETSFTEDTAFWTGIRNSTEALSFNNYFRFMDWIFCGGEPPNPENGFEDGRFLVKQRKYDHLKNQRFLSFTDSDTYRVVKAATEAFVMVNCGIQQVNCGVQQEPLPLPFDPNTNRPNRDDAYLDRRDLPIPDIGLSDAFGQYLVPVNGDKTLPYLAVIRRKLPDITIKTTLFENAIPRIRNGGQAEILDNCFGILQDKLTNPCLLELIWSYWHEEGMLVQTMNALSRRFQNMRSSAQDPLANLEMDPLRPLNNLLWSYIQDEQNRLTINRRNYEYDHHYGLRLEGKAVQNFRPADTRSKFLEAFHHLLRLCAVFYKQDDDTTVKADAFPVLNALKEVHLILSEGAHNQFGDLPSTARIEMLIQQWLLARPEFREFLPTRIMVAYPEPWMDRVDAMKKLQGWTDTSVVQFRNLAMFGEQLFLSIRWGHWSDEFEPVKALNWARFFRPQVQGYIHAYRAATGVDLSADPTVNARVDSTLPSVLLQKRLASQLRTN